MPDQLEDTLRDAFSQHAAQLDPESIARLRAIDYHPRERRIRRLPAFGALGATGIAATAGVIVALGSTAAPAFAGWQSTPTSPAPGQLAAAAQDCGANLGSPVLTDSRGPYTAAIYANPTTSNVCLSGNGVSMSTSTTSSSPKTVAPGQIQFFAGGGRRDAAGNALTFADGRIGSGVTGVTIKLSDGSSVQATVSNGWYMAWWPGSVTAASAEVTAASGTSTVNFPSPRAQTCPAGATCGYGYGGGSNASGTGQSTMSVHSSASVSH